MTSLLIFLLLVVGFVQADDSDSLAVVPLFSQDSELQPPTLQRTEQALVTRLGDRVRDRHARESEFQAYDHFLSWYWEERTVSIELIDHVAMGGTTIDVRISSLAPLNEPNFRAFFRGRNTVAEYFHNVVMEETRPNQYATSISRNAAEGRELRVGDRMEFEFSPFLKDATNGRNNYYGTAYLYIIGRGIVPWEPRGEQNDSVPLAEASMAGGFTTLHVPMSDEPAQRFKQMATNMSPANAQSFVLGRRLHHTHFGTGQHSEQPNPVYEEQQGKLGPAWAAGSCVACHRNNGRALPTEVNEPLSATVVKTSATNGSPHDALGSALQSHGTEGEGFVRITRFETSNGAFTDGTFYQLRKPAYAFSGVSPNYYSVRLSPQLVGLGLLEAIPESAILELADPDDADNDDISGRPQIVRDPESGVPRLGRFGYKAAQPTVRHQIAGALNSDMGVTTSVFQSTDGAEEPDENPELSDESLRLLTAYISTLGVPARRDVESEKVQRGSQLFSSIGCAKCHVPSFETSQWAERSELRSQKIQPWTDMLLHDMGPGLADKLTEGRASGSEWRTAPLWGIGLTKGVSGREAWLHDGRARTLEEAILWHGGEAEQIKEAFRNLDVAARSSVIAFLRSL